MPELPEVETIARLLRKPLLGKRIRRARILWNRTVAENRADDLLREIPGARILGTKRRGKFLHLELDGPRQLVVHLRMSGRLQCSRLGEPESPWLRATFDLDGGERLDFIDPRKFGRLYWLQDPAEIWSALGPEPLGEAFGEEWLSTNLRRRARMLKPLLLDQTFIAGLGNIYTDEVLHVARLHPRRRADRLRAADCARLARAVREVLEEAIADGGSSFDAFYRTPEGRPGAYQESFRVYGREGQPCRSCGRPIRRILVAQRGTHLCPGCQRRRP